MECYISVLVAVWEEWVSAMVMELWSRCVQDVGRFACP